MKLFKKLLYLNLILSVAPILIIIFITFKVGQAEVENQTQTLSEKELSSLSSELSNFFNARRNEVHLLSESPILQSMDWQEIKPYLKSERDRLSEYYEKFILGKPNGHFYNTSGGNIRQGGIRTFDDSLPDSQAKTIKKRKYWQVGISGEIDRPYVSEPMVSYTTGVQQVVVSNPIKKDGAVVGMLGGALSWKIFENKLNELSGSLKNNMGQGVKLFLISDKGSYVYHWDESKSLKYDRNPDGSLKLNDINEPIVSGSTIQNDKGLSEVSSTVLARQQVNTEVNENGESFRYFFIPVKDTRYSLGIKVPTAIFLEAVTSHRNRLFLIALISLFLTVSFSYIFSRRISQRVTALNDAASDFKEGKKVEVNISGNDEITDLYKTFASMCREVEEKINIITNTKNELKDHKKNLEKTVEKRTKELESALQKAEQGNRMKSEFVANISHEIRTPMNAVLGFTEHLLESEINTEQREQLETLHGAAESLLVIINDLLDFSKLEDGKLEIEKIPFELDRTVRDVLKIVAVKADAKGLELKECLDHKHKKFEGDPNRIKQVLLNFLGNAVKFTDKGSVTLKASEEKSSDKSLIRFEVIDTGIGISKEAQERLFQRFEQEDASTTRKYGGSGLGLSISKSLVELMNGKVGVESKQNEGSCFWFEIELPHVDKVENSLEDTQATRLNFDNVSALVVDDNKVNLKLAKLSLEKSGVSVITAESGQEAISYLEENSTDIIFMDYLMPEMDGLEATLAIRKLEHCSEIPIIALTANAMKEDQEKCMAAGMSGFIAKPFTKNDIQNVLNQWAG